MISKNGFDLLLAVNQVKETQLWCNSNSTCHATYWMYIPSFKLISQSMLKKSPENAHGRTDGQTDIPTACYVRFSNGCIIRSIKWQHWQEQCSAKVFEKWRQMTHTIEKYGDISNFSGVTSNCHSWISNAWGHWPLQSKKVGTFLISMCQMSPKHSLGITLQEIPQPSVTKISIKIKYLKFHANLPGVNELKDFHCKVRPSSAWPI